VEFELACNLVLLALGFTGPERNGVVAELGLKLDPAARSPAMRLGDQRRGRLRLR